MKKGTNDIKLAIGGTQIAKAFVGNMLVYSLNEYTELSYIQGSGAQYIDTGMPFNSNYTYKFKYKRNNTNGTPLAGYRTGSSAGTGQNCSFTYGGSSEGLYYASGASSSTVKMFSPLDTNEHEIVFNPANSLFTFDGVDKWYSLWITTQVVSNLNFCLFVDNRPSIVNGMNGRFYNFQVFDGNTLIQNLIPCKRNSDNAVGMYDTINDVFLTNAGSGTFVAGDPV